MLAMQLPLTEHRELESSAKEGMPRLNDGSSPNLAVNEKKPMGVEEQVDHVRSFNYVT